MCNKLPNSIFYLPAGLVDSLLRAHQTEFIPFDLFLLCDCVHRHHCCRRRRINSGDIIQNEKSKLCQKKIYNNVNVCFEHIDCVRAMTRFSYPFIHKCFARHSMADISNCIFSFFASVFFSIAEARFDANI